MSNDNSDYTKPRMNLFDLLPEVYQSDTNRSVFENLFNRFLTKAETERVSGYIGQGNPAAIVKRQIQEFDVHRQAYQLQPLLYNKIGSVEHMASWKDMMNEAERLGIDPDAIKQWLDLLQFNWAPPIDIDKLIHYRDYYWVSETNDLPQYITVRSRCGTAIAIAKFQEEIIESAKGESMPITRVLPVDPFVVFGIDEILNTITINGDATPYISEGTIISVSGTTSNNGTYEATDIIEYNAGANETTVRVVENITVSEDVGFAVVQNIFDKLVVDGPQNTLFTKGFIFYIKNVINADLNEKYHEVLDSYYDEAENETVFTLTFPFNDDTIAGAIASFTEARDAAFAARDCICSGSVGWDLAQWDDNPVEPSLWVNIVNGITQSRLSPCGDVITDWSSLMTSISNAGPPTAPCGDGQLWFDTVADVLYQYYEETDWVAIQPAFSNIVDVTAGNYLWDETIGCGGESPIIGMEQWSSQNKWLHKNDVENFATAQQATVPIIEFQWDLELNEWTETTYEWKYRDTREGPFDLVDTTPEYIELVQLTKYQRMSGTDDTFELSDEYGDLTDYFHAGRRILFPTSNRIFTVVSSHYASRNPGEPWFTTFTVDEDVVADLNFGNTQVVPPVETTYVSDGTPAPITPILTSRGDQWKGYDQHWVYTGNSNTLPINHQPPNPLGSIDETALPATSTDYEYRSTYYTQEYLITAAAPPVTYIFSAAIGAGTTRSMQARAYGGTNAVRVYINDIRQYGTYVELVGIDGYVNGVLFSAGRQPERYDTLRIEVGEATPSDFGWGVIPVRMAEDNDAFINEGLQDRSFVRYHKEEQVKAERNQYPLFDLYYIDSESANVASSIFKYGSDPTADANIQTGVRMKTDTNSLDYVFEQGLLTDDNKILAYRDYANSDYSIWVDPERECIHFWTGTTWSDYLQVGRFYMRAFIEDTPPTFPASETEFEGAYWYNTATRRLLRWTQTGAGLGWEPVSAYVSNTDPTLQTIWKKGLNDEKYDAEQRDWDRRTLAEFNEQKNLYVEERAEEIILTEPDLSEAEAVAKADSEWDEEQTNHLSTDGGWVGDWELPDPLYYNHSHENRREVSMAELITHFDTIIEAQDTVPGFVGPKSNMFRLIPVNEVNYGVGGKIREYNHGLDLFLSALFNTQVSPRTLFEFAQDQYEVSLNALREIYRRGAVEYLTSTNPEHVADLSGYITQTVIEAFEQNDANAALYGDSTTYHDGVGMRNFIATLPFLGLQRPTLPSKQYDPARRINQIIHHDGHRNNYFLADATIEGITRGAVSTPDLRTSTTGNVEDAKPFGVIPQPSTPPPNNTSEFQLWFDTAIPNREGVFWYQPEEIPRKFYRLQVAEIGVTAPSSSLPDGTLWLDLRAGVEVLRHKVTNTNTGDVEWQVPDGLVIGEFPIRLHNGTDPSDLTTATVSAWEEVDLDSFLTDIILEIETRLYQAIPTYVNLRYDIDQLETDNRATFTSHMSEQFSAHASEAEIAEPFTASRFDASNPFTWNYKHSAIGKPYSIIDVDEDLNAFVVSGHFATAFTSSSHIYIKNSDFNDGTWTLTGVKAEDSCADDNVAPVNCPQYSKTTTIYVEEPITAVPGGIIYQGLLALTNPAPTTAPPELYNDGSESGGDWRDLYQKVYGTPYPHLEPWTLQGYQDKPDWWDAEYLNDNPRKWGDRRWKYKHGFEILGTNPLPDTFEINGDFREIFYPGRQFAVTDSQAGAHDATWMVGSLLPIVPGSVNTGAATTATFRVAGDHVSRLMPGTQFVVGTNTGVANSRTTPGTITQLLTVSSSVFTGPPTNETIVVVEQAIESDVGFDQIVNVFYDSVTNLTTIGIETTNVQPLDTFSTDLTVIDANGMIRIRHGMWDNIYRRIIPPQYARPVDYEDWPLPIVNYMSVNITNGDIDGYEPDAVFPPYWDYFTHYNGPLPTFDQMVRSIFTSFSTEVMSEGADYNFADAGYVEWVWRNSSQYLYDRLAAAFRLDPVRMLYLSFGMEFYDVAGLLVDKRTERVATHLEAIFHGDLQGTDVVQFNGLNQWYVNYLRYASVDMSMSDFRSTWSEWTAPLSYQFSSFIDTPSFDIAHRLRCISNFDYRVAAKRSPGTEDYWLESFDIYTLSMPPKIARYDNQFAWKFEVRTKPPYTKTVEYYDVQNYQFYADPDTDLFTLYSWDVRAVNPVLNSFTIDGDRTDIFIADRTFSVDGSTANNGIYTITTAVYNSVDNRTIVSVLEDITSIVGDGRITLDYKRLPWATGDRVVLSTAETLPVPLQGDNVNGVYYYYFIRVSDTTFRLASTEPEARNGMYIDVTSKGRSDQYVGKILTTFTDDVSGTLWRHYALDKSNDRLTFMPPHQFNGIQSIVDFADGYEAYAIEQGWRFNIDGSIRDAANTSFTVSWQHELRRFIQFNMEARRVRAKVEDRYPVELDDALNSFTITDNSRPQFITGEPVTIYSSNQLYPQPLVHGGRYYIIRDEISKFRLAPTKGDAIAGVAIDLTTNVGSENLFLVQPSLTLRNTTKFELNPFRTAVWFRPERGIVSNLLTGPTEDVFTSQLIVDQYGRPIRSDDIRVFREDKETKITIEDQLDNDVEPVRIYQNPYNFLHLGAVHLFIDTYEHVLVFNDRTTEDSLIYDAFVGLNLTKFEMLFNRQTQFTQRPNIGGQYLRTFFNQGADLERNIEGSIEDLRNLYDTYRVIEANELIQQSRKTMGYEGREEFLDNLNLNEKSQFAFWRGQIQHKGALTSVKSFVNSRRFIDARLDEFWAVKIGEFGSMRDKEYIDMVLNVKDTISNELRLEFIQDDDVCNAGFAVDPYDTECGYAYPNSGESVDLVDEGWTSISMADEDRWHLFPNQLSKLANNAGTLYFDLKLEPDTKIHYTEPFRANIGLYEDPADDNMDIQMDRQLIRHNLGADHVSIQVTHEDTPAAGFDGSDHFLGPFSAGETEIFLNIGYIPFASAIRVWRGFYDVPGPPDSHESTFQGRFLTSGVDYTEQLDHSTLITGDIFSFGITMAEPLAANEVVRVQYRPATLVRDVHYTEITSNIIRMDFDGLLEQIGRGYEMVIYGWKFDKGSLNPHRIIDTANETTVNVIQHWDPARGSHYYLAPQAWDAERPDDLAVYNNTPELLAVQKHRINSPDIDVAPWGSEQVGYAWLDTSRMKYKPYYDQYAFPDEDNRFKLWGELADYGDINIRTWVESDVPPEEWNALAAIESGDTSIDQRNRKAGTISPTLYERDTNTNWVVARDRRFVDDMMFNTESVSTDDDGRITEAKFPLPASLFGYPDLATLLPLLIESGADDLDEPAPGTASDDSLIARQKFEGLGGYLNGQQLTRSSAALEQRPSWFIEFDATTITLVCRNVTPTDRIEIMNFPPGRNPHLSDADNATALETIIGYGAEYVEQYPHVTDTVYDQFGFEQTRYYFWADGKETKGTKNIAPATAEQSMVDIPVPFVIYEGVELAQSVEYQEETIDLPVHYNRAILRGLRNVVNVNNRYIIRWLRDETLRDTLETGRTALEKKNLHEQWELIRREQPSHIPRWLWDKLTEAIVGYKLDDPTTRVPTLSRELYDDENGTDTRIGLGDGQAFTDGPLSKMTILADLNNADNDFTPVDINVFFQQYNFDTPEATAAAMATIYNTFPYLHVNRMFFDCLLDAFSKKNKYEDIFKTSMVSLHGVRPFQVGGLFDD